MPTALLALTSMTGCSKGLGSADTDNLNVNIDTHGVELDIWTGFGEGGANPKQKLEDILETFTQKTGIKVTHTSKGGYDNLQQAIDLSVTTKDYPNVALGYPDHFAGYINSNIQLRLDGLLKNDSKREMVKKDEEGFDVDADGIRRMDYKDFYTDFVEENETLEHKSNGEGYVLGLPFNKSSEVMVYNAQFFDWVKTRSELKDKIFVPSTWEEVSSVNTEVRKFFQEKGVMGKLLLSDGNVYDAMPEGTTLSLVFDGIKANANNDKGEFRLLSYDSTSNAMTTFLRQFDSRLTEIDEKVSLKGYAAFNDAKYRENTLKATATIRKLGEEKAFGIPASFGESLYCSTPFKNYKSLLNIGSTGGVSNCIGSFAVKAHAIPQNGANEKKFVISQGTNLALFNKGTEAQKVAAWKLMIYLSQQANGTFASQTGYFPTCKAAYNSTDYQDYLNNSYGAGEKLQQDAAIINSIEYTRSGWTRFTDPGFQGSSAVRTECGFIPGKILANEGTDQAILDASYVVLQDYVRK